MMTKAELEKEREKYRDKLLKQSASILRDPFIMGMVAAQFEKMFDRCTEILWPLYTKLLAHRTKVDYQLDKTGEMYVKLENKLTTAVEALEFYASDELDVTEQTELVEPASVGGKTKIVSLGKTARTALEKIRGEK